VNADTVRSLSSCLAEIDRCADESQTLLTILDGKLRRQKADIHAARQTLDQVATEPNPEMFTEARQ